VFLHNMFPFERFMGVWKKYVHNRAGPEGNISKGYGTEEVIEFCIDFLPDLKPIGVPESRYEHRLMMARWWWCESFFFNTRQWWQKTSVPSWRGNM
jgi:hypothetical protein